MHRFIEEHAKIDPHFQAFCQSCRQAGLDVKIISDGLDFYIRKILDIHQLSDVPFFANQARFLKGDRMALAFPNCNDACGRCGTCKKNLVQLYRQSYDSILVVGNGLSDRCAAREADFVFAKDSLYAYCIDQDIPCHFFGDFGEIQADLQKKIRGLIFDLDGTLIEAHEAIYLGMEKAFRSFGRTLFPFSEIKKHLKADLEKTLAPFFSPEEIRAAIPIIRKKYEEVYPERTHFLDGAGEVLKTLGSRGIVMAVASNKFGRFSRGALTHLGVADHFRSVLGAGDGLRNKPFPDMIHASMKEMDLSARDVVFVGDSVEDIEAGKQAGVDVCAIPTGIHTKSELARAKPKRILKELKEIVPWVEQGLWTPKEH
jgi:HAD superfamily hydrolase (TIGR01509 family)